MEEQETIIHFLDNFGAGTFISVSLALVLGAIFIIKKFMKTKKDYDSSHKKKILEEQKQEKNTENVQHIYDKVSELELKIDDQGKELKEYFDERCDLLETRVTATERLTEDLTNYVRESRMLLNNISETLDSTNNSINILIDSDCQTIEAFIMSEYCKWVEDKKEIDLISLQNIEKMYKKYLEEVGENNDKFIEKLVMELRNLPTKK